MTKTIFTVSVHVKNQEHADNLKKICIQNDLSIDDEGGFAYHKKYGCEFYYLKTKKSFYGSL